MSTASIIKSAAIGRRRPSNLRNGPALGHIYSRRLQCEPLEDRRLLSVFVVESTGDDHLQSGAMFSNPVAGQPDTYALPSLRAAVEAADQNPGADTITFAPSLAGQTITLTNYTLELSDTSGTTTITGPGASQLTIDGNNDGTVFQVAGGVTADISGLTISHGYSSNYSGGIWNRGTLSLTDCTLSQNTATLAGGIGGGICNFGALSVTDCTLSGNSVTGIMGEGGGIYNSGTATVAGTTFSGNSASNCGGGIFNDSGGTLTLVNCTLSGNSAQGYDGGGGIGNAGAVSVTDCTLSGNSATGEIAEGGGIYNDMYATLSAVNSTFVGNTAHACGGIFNLDTLSVTNCTLSGNSAQSDGGGLYNIDGRGTATLANTIVAGNKCSGSPDISGPVTANYCLIGDPTGALLSTQSTYNITGVDPLLGPLGNYGGPTDTLPLLPGSPAIGAGDNGLALDASGNPLTTDQRGVERIVNGIVDIGAFESRGFTMSLSGGNNQQTVVGTRFADPLAVEVTSEFSEPVEGGQVTFTPPATGASATFSGGSNTATIDSSGLAQFIATANDTLGPYTVSAAAAGALGPVSFNLFNLDNAETPRLLVNTAKDVVDGNNGLTSLREAIAYANTHPGDDTITFDPSLAGQTITLANGPLELSDTSGTTTITGLGANQLTIDGNNATTIFQVDSGVTANISGLTISHGSTTSEGGGGIANGGTLSLTDCTLSQDTAGNGGTVSNDKGGTVTLPDSALSGNLPDAVPPPPSAFGGGIFNFGAVTLTDCTLSGDSAFNGGGICNESSGTVTLTDSTLSGNSATGVGAGICNLDGTVTLTDCTLSQNTATYGGGGICNARGTVTLTDSTLSQNTALFGGGIENDWTATVTTTDCTFSGNSAQTEGGGIFNYGALSVTDCTLSGNSAQSFGGGLYSYYSSSTATLANTIVAGNTCSGSPDISGPVTANYCLIGNTTGATLSGSSANNITGLDPLLGPLGNYGGLTDTLPLLPGSPAIDAGNNNLAVDASGNPLTTDQRGADRIVNGTVDIGAFESQGFTISSVVVVDATTNGSTLLSTDPIEITWQVNGVAVVGNKSLSVNGNAVTTMYGPYAAGADTWYLGGVVGPLAAGTHTFSIHSGDNSGNVAIPYAESFTVLAPTGPTISSVVVVDAKTNSSTLQSGDQTEITWAVGGTASVSTESLSVNGKAVTPIYGPYAAGANTWYLGGVVGPLTQAPTTTAFSRPTATATPRLPTRATSKLYSRRQARRFPTSSWSMSRRTAPSWTWATRRKSPGRWAARPA